MGLWERLKDAMTGYTELPQQAVSMDGTQMVNPNIYKAQLQAQQDNLPQNIIDAMGQGKNGGNLQADKLLKDNNAYEQLQEPKRHKGLADFLLGTPQQDITAYDDKGNPIYSESRTRQGGFLRDLASGANENYNSSISLDNLTNNLTSEGKQKGFGYRLGEGLGTLGRFAQSPTGRGLITAGLVGLTGGNALQSLAFGGQAGALNQRLRNEDKIYRNDLINYRQSQLQNSSDYNTLSPTEKQSVLEELKNDESYKKANDTTKKQMLEKALLNTLRDKQAGQMQSIEDEINGYRGYVTNQPYSNMIRTAQLRDNAEYRNLMLTSMDENRKAMQKLREEEIQNRKLQNQFQNNMAMANLGLKQQEMANNNYYRQQDLNIKRAQLKNKSDSNNFADIEQQLNNFVKTFKILPSKTNAYTMGKIRVMTGTQTKTEANFESQRALLFNVIARKLNNEKGALSDQDINRIDNALPKLTDSYAQKLAKMKAVYDLLNIKKGVTNKRDPLGIR